MSLFERGMFILASGQTSPWKVECDALTDEDWAALALIAEERLRLRFGNVVGVPRGGLPFARAMKPYATEGPLLVVDDVLTTGGSLLALMQDDALGLVAFARGPLPPNVQALWTLAVSDEGPKEA